MLALAMVAILLGGTGHEQTGDSVAVQVTFGATGGTVTPRGFYTCGSTPGDFKVVIREKLTGVADTASVRVKAATTASGSVTTVYPPPVKGVGIPFGPYGASDGYELRASADAFTLGVGPMHPEDLVHQFAGMRTTKHRVLLMMTGGAHKNYLTDGVFDFNKWKAKIDEYDTPTIKAAVAAGVADGTIIGTSVMDEPQNTTPGKAWGPAGYMTKARVDEMCGYVKAIFPTLPAGVVHDHRVFEPDKSYRTCDFIVTQYRWSKTKGNAAEFRDEALALGKRDGIAIAFSLNILDGGLPRRQTDPCPIPETGGLGASARACRMTPEQVRDWGLVLGPAGCALTVWRYDSDFMSNPENIHAFNDVAAALAKAPAKPCRRQ